MANKKKELGPAALKLLSHWQAEDSSLLLRNNFHVSISQGEHFYLIFVRGKNKKNHIQFNASVTVSPQGEVVFYEGDCSQDIPDTFTRDLSKELSRRYPRLAREYRIDWMLSQFWRLIGRDKKGSVDTSSQEAQNQQPLEDIVTFNN